MKKLDEKYRNFTSNLVDSEVYFRYLIQSIEKENDIISGIIKGIKEISDTFKSGANFLLSDGIKLYVFRYNNPLNFLIRDPSNYSTIHFRSSETSALIESKRMLGEKAVLVATEKLTDENWMEIENGYLLLIDSNLNVFTYKII